MTDPIELPIKPRASLPYVVDRLGTCPGRNHPGIGEWLITSFTNPARMPRVVDPMCGGGQLWMLGMAQGYCKVWGCDLNLDRVYIARSHGIRAEPSAAEHWTPPIEPDLVAFSPPYPNCNKVSGKTQHQQDLVASKGLHNLQKIEGSTNLLPVFQQIATYRGRAPVAVITRNWVRNQQEVDWTSDVEQSMRMAGLGEVRRYYRLIPPGPTEQWKLSRAKKNGGTHRVIDREWVLVAMPEVAK